MKTLAAVNVGIYEKADYSLAEYFRTIELGLIAILRQNRPFITNGFAKDYTSRVGAIVFGSDQGMVGPFNEHLANAVLSHAVAAELKSVWAVGERVALKLSDSIKVEEPYRVPDSAAGITSLVSRIVIDVTREREAGRFDRLFIFYNNPHAGGTYEPVARQLLPVDHQWLTELERKRWMTNMLPQVMPEGEEALEVFYQEYLFITLCRACASSLVSENISRLASMQRAAKNIGDLLEELNTDYNQERQSSITAELFDVIFGYNALQQDGMR